MRRARPPQVARSISGFMNAAPEGDERQRVQERAQVLCGQRLRGVAARAAEAAEHDARDERGDEAAAAERRARP